MDKIKTLKKLKLSTKREKPLKNKKQPILNNFDGLIEDEPQAFLLNPNNVGAAIMECLAANDPEGVIEVINIYVRALNKEQFMRKAELGKSSYYYLMKNKNPTIKTLAKIVHAMTA